jgi:integral membrane protein (TIGR01906 family)
LWRKESRKLAKEALYGAGLTLLLIVLAGAGVAINFSQLWRLFHLLSFTNELWMLDPSKDYLIMLVPEGFWFDAVIFVAVMIVAGAIIAGAAGWVYLKKSGVMSGADVASRS